MKPIVRCGKLLLVLALLAIAAGARAQGYPGHAVRLVVADAAGGAPDQLARLVAQKVSETLGQQVIVDNRPGAGGAVGADHVAK
jgi:tripartite-type tricarboxylate transporter receptor subunit TctC